MLAKVTSVTHLGLDGHSVQIESDLSNSLPGLSVIGLVGKSVDEAKERIKSAIRNSQLTFPAKRITLSLAPADIPKSGSHFDLAMAVSILAATGQIPQPDPNWLFYGELSLDGRTRSTQGSLSAAVYAKENGINKLYIAAPNAHSAALITGVSIYPVEDLKSLYLHLIGEKPIQPVANASKKTQQRPQDGFIDFNDIIGQTVAKRALSIAIAGNHNILLTGTPGAGKTMLARAAAFLLPALNKDEAIETTRIHNLAGITSEDICSDRPFRNPHHSVSYAGLVGGGQKPRPGEISLAHNGVLFLDEFAEFSRRCLETLRQPLEEGKVTIARAASSLVFPAKFLLIAAQNPCPCGYLHDENQNCTCSAAHINHYSQKISGPLLDRIDLKIWVKRLNTQDISANSNSSTANSLSSAEARQLIKSARAIQAKRYRGNTFATNAELDHTGLKAYCQLDSKTTELLDQATSKLCLSMRGRTKVIKVSRTIADLDNSTDIRPSHLAEALQYR